MDYLEIFDTVEEAVEEMEAELDSYEDEEERYWVKIGIFDANSEYSTWSGYVTEETCWWKDGCIDCVVKVLETR